MKPYFLFLPIPVLLLTSCGSEPARRAAQPQAPPVAVQVVSVTTQDWPTSYEATGTIRARTTATISSKVMGYVQQVSVQVGDRVRQGQELITLDARDTAAYNFQQGGGPGAAGECPRRRPCSPRAGIDYAGRAGPGREPAPRRGRRRRGAERHPRTGECHGRRQSQSGFGANHLQAYGRTGGQEIDLQSGVG